MVAVPLAPPGARRESRGVALVQVPHGRHEGSGPPGSFLASAAEVMRCADSGSTWYSRPATEYSLSAAGTRSLLRAERFARPREAPPRLLAIRAAASPITCARFAYFFTNFARTPGSCRAVVDHQHCPSTPGRRRCDGGDADARVISRPAPRESLEDQRVAARLLHVARRQEAAPCLARPWTT